MRKIEILVDCSESGTRASVVFGSKLPQRSRVIMVKMLHATLLSLIITGITSVGAQAPVFISSAGSSKCLTVKGSQFNDGTAVEINDCNNPTAQKWELGQSTLTEVTIENQGMEFCLDAKTVDAGSPVVIWKCNKSAWQKWTFNSDGFLQLVNTQLCLGVPNSSTDNGVQVETYACNANDLNQIWNLINS